MGRCFLLSEVQYAAAVNVLLWTMRTYILHYAQMMSHMHFISHTASKIVMLFLVLKVLGQIHIRRQLKGG